MADSSFTQPTSSEKIQTGDGYGLLLIKYKLLFDHARDMILFIDKNGKILDANKAALDTYGYTKEEITDLSIFDLRFRDPADLVKAQMQQASSSSIIFETVHRTKDGRIIPVEVSSTGADVAGEFMLMSIVRDISAKQEYIARIKQLAFYDEMTGVPNRKSFRDALHERIAQEASRFALMLIDIDDFKKVNDTFSHYIGDELLTEMARRLTEALGSRGTLYRLGGDEFTVLADIQEGEKDLLAIISDIRTAAGKTFNIDGSKINSSLSIGISLFPDNGKDEALLLKLADNAMYRVKEASKDGYAFYS